MRRAATASSASIKETAPIGGRLEPLLGRFRADEPRELPSTPPLSPLFSFAHVPINQQTKHRGKLA